MEDVTIYKPNQRHELSYIQTIVIIIRNVINSKDLIWQLYKRDYFATYKKSFLGVAWAFLTPLFSIISWVFLKKAGLLNPGDTVIPYTAYVLIGTSMWGLFMGFYKSSSETLLSISKLALNVNFPREAILFKQAAMQLTNFAITFVITIIVLLMFGVIPSYATILLPLVILPLFFLGASIGLIVSMLAIVAFDIKNFINVIMRLLLFITPVIYSDKIKVEWVKEIISLNPLTYLVCSARDIVIYGRLYDTQGYFICAGISFILFLVSLRIFYISENKIIERMI